VQPLIGELMGSLGAPELIILLVVLVLLFGSTKLPQLARSLGQAKNEFARGGREADDQHEAE
jgi:sec-independent protein translocase protein TatA